MNLFELLAMAASMTHHFEQLGIVDYTRQEVPRETYFYTLVHREELDEPTYANAYLFSPPLNNIEHLQLKNYCYTLIKRRLWATVQLVKYYNIYMTWSDKTKTIYYWTYVQEQERYIGIL